MRTAQNLPFLGSLRYSEPSSMLKIREYRQQDKGSVIALIQSLQDHVAELDPFKLNKQGPAFLAARYVEYLMNRTAREQGMIYVAEQEGKVIGCIGGVVEEEPDDLETYKVRSGRIVDLVVSAQHRGNQVGRKLMLAMEQHFKACTCDFVRVGCFGYNHDAHRFYEKCGYHERFIEMIKKYPSGSFPPFSLLSKKNGTRGGLSHPRPLP